MTAKKAAKSASKSAKKSASKSEPDNSAKDLLKRAKANIADTPIGGNVLGNEPLGPGVEHEDHEGGLTDSLAKKGVRYIPNADEKKKLGEDKTKVFAAPSVRERQTAPFARSGRPFSASGSAGGAGDAVGQLQAEAKAKEARTVVVIATRVGQYPAQNGRIRRRGDVFEYEMHPDEEKLPSWVIARDGGIESRTEGETSPTFQRGLAAVIDVARDGTTTTRDASTFENNSAASKKASKK